MAFRSTAPKRTALKRTVLMGLAVAGALAGTAGAASAQIYLYEEDAPYLEQRFGYGYRYAAPRPPAQIPLRALGRIAARDFGLAQVDRTVATGSAYVVDGRTRAGARVRLILDPYSGELLDRIVLREPSRAAPRVARIDPRDEARPPRAAPRPPERPPSLKPPGQASAPATVVPPSPATPPHAEPAPPAEKPPAAASAPATEVPPTPAAPAAPTPGPADPATGADKPRLVNPSDVRGTETTEREPPLARTEQPGIPAQLPPVQTQDATPTTPKPETPDVPVTPLD